MPLRSILRSAGLLAGLPVLAALWAGTTLIAEPHWRAALERDADAVVRGTAATAGEPWLRVELAGRDAVARGEAPGPEARAEALAALAAVPGLRRVVDRVDLVSTQSPFVWSARRRALGRIDVMGYRPAEIGRAALAARLAAALPADEAVRDGARAARGAPSGLSDAAVLAVSILPRLAPGATAELADTVLAVRGEAATVADQEAVLATLGRLPPPFRAGTVEIEPPVIEPFTWALTRAPDGALALSGYVPSARAREAILAAARAAAEGAPVADAMRPGRGLDARVEPQALARVALDAASLLHDGTVSLSGTRLSVRGEALDAQAVGEIRTILERAPERGLSAGEVALTARPPRPYRVAARRSAEAVVLTGHLPDAQARGAALGALRPLLFGERIVDRTRLAEGAPPGLATAFAAGLGELALLASGEVAVEDRTLRITGESPYAETAARAGAEATRLAPPGWSVSATVGVPGRVALDSASCRERFAAQVAARPLRFPTASADLTPDFYPVLDDLAALARDCRDARVTVAGHRDGPAPAPAGPAAKPAPADPELPRRRALAVVDYLLKAGAAPERVEAVADPADRAAAAPRGIVVEFRP